MNVSHPDPTRSRRADEHAAPVAARALAREVAVVEVGRISRPVRLVATDVTAGEVDRLFRHDAQLDLVAVDSPTPLLIERVWFESMMTGRLGFGRLLHARSSIADLRPPHCPLVPASEPVTAVAEALIASARTHIGAEHVLVRHPDGHLRAVSAAAVFSSLAEHHSVQALHDPLTGLPNRLMLLERLREYQSDTTGVTLFYIDLDRFKHVNDGHGHAVGDQVLVTFAQRLAALSREPDLAIRIGGDEFALLVEGALSERSASALAERILDQAAVPFTVRASENPDDAAESVAIGASVGVAHLDPCEPGSRPGSFELLLKQADTAMYQAKRSGRGRHVTFVAGVLPESAAETQRSADIERRLRSAIAHGSLALHYQPIVDYADGRVVSVEALARWHDPELGSVSPDEFIAVAERCGLIHDLGLWVLDTACAAAVGWSATTAGPPPIVAVNISALQVSDPSFVDNVVAALHRSGLAPDRLCLELTETAAVTDLVATAQRLNALRDLGVQLALDDFGTGYSSLTMLRRLPLHVVKIDRSFVTDIEDNPNDVVLVRLVIDTAHSLGLRVCAEGIETAAQATQLRVLGADTAQGWYLGMPEPDSPRLRDRFGQVALTDSVNSSEGMRALLGGSPELVVLTDADRTINYVSSASNAVLGYRPSELIGTSISDHLAPEGVLLTDDDTNTQRIRHRDGTYRWLSTYTQFLRDEDGQIRQVLTTARDVTTMIEAQQALRHTESQFEQVFENAPIGMCLGRLDGSLMRVNETFARLLGYSQQDILGMTMAELLYPDDLTDSLQRLGELVAGRLRQFDVARRYRHADGGSVSLVVRVALVQGPDGQTLVAGHILPADAPSVVGLQPGRRDVGIDEAAR